MYIHVYIYIYIYTPIMYIHRYTHIVPADALQEGHAGRLREGY